MQRSLPVRRALLGVSLAALATAAGVAATGPAQARVAGPAAATPSAAAAPSAGPRTPGDPGAQLSTGMMPADSPDARAHAVARGARAMTAAASSFLTGIDVASYQHNSPISWSTVRSSGQAFAIVKATEGTGYVNPYEEGDVAGARAAGLRVGLYHFARPSLSGGSAAADAVAEADYFAARINRIAGAQLPPTLDLEVNGGLTVAQLQQWVSAFLGRVQSDTGRLPMIYTGPYFWNTYVQSTAFTRYPLWEAHYTSAAAPQQFGGWPTYTLWQWSDGSGATQPGISGAVDRDRYAGGLAGLEALESASNGVSAPFTGTASPAALPDGLLVRVVGTPQVYVVAGRAPVYVNTLAGYPGNQAVHVISAGQFYSLRSQPLDGTFLRDVATGGVFTVAGQAPVAVTSWAPWGGAVQPYVDVTDAAVTAAGQPGVWSHLRALPLDGTFLLAGETGAVFEVAGGAPLYVRSWSYFGGVQPTVRITQSTVDNAVMSAAPSRFSHLLFWPANGTLLEDASAGTYWDVEGGTLTSTTAQGRAFVPVTDDVIVNAGRPGWYAHLMS